MFTEIAIISALAGLATAAPVANYEPTGPVANSNRFIATAIHNTSPVQNAVMSANGGSFYIGRDAGTYCPPGANCSKYITGATVFLYNPALKTLYLSTAAPGGQQVFVRSDGSLGFTLPHSTGTINDAYVFPFQYTAQTEGGVVGELDFEKLNFNACPAYEGPNGSKIYKIYSRAVGLEGQGEECIDIKVATAIWTGPNPYEYN